MGAIFFTSSLNCFFMRLAFLFLFSFFLKNYVFSQVREATIRHIEVDSVVTEYLKQIEQVDIPVFIKLKVTSLSGIPAKFGRDSKLKDGVGYERFSIIDSIVFYLSTPILSSTWMSDMPLYMCARRNAFILLYTGLEEIIEPRPVVKIGALKKYIKNNKYGYPTWKVKITQGRVEVEVLQEYFEPY
jgi:hypothetical protein